MNAIRLPGFTYVGEVVSADGRVLDTFSVGNLIPQQGINYVIGALDGTGSVIPAWYLGVFKNDYTPVNNTTASALPTTIGEHTGYDEGSRPPWTPTYDNIGRLDNEGSLAEFTMNQDVTLYGAFIVSESTKGGGAGTLLSIARFPSPKQIESGSVLRIRAGVEVVAG